MDRRSEIDEKYGSRLNELRQAFIDVCNTDFGPASPPRDWEAHPWTWFDDASILTLYLDEAVPDWQENFQRLWRKTGPVRDLLGMSKPYHKKRPTGRSAEITAAPSLEGE